ncbi:integrase/recombinase XerD [Methylosinus sp. sav-2]|uniref:tyrosine-type recombinase/integrase n=1 Tax=Methylosinus sp. sav-2 TaxID=2485168 RepID=UPI00047D7D1C|nr:site-specific integrase [Methylosinus sp. sav-2]TDX61976.1 integrase/recombinase XerD [Methylosinus sp. sav-2]
MREPNLYTRGGVFWLRATVRGVEHRESLRTRDLATARRLRDKRIEEIAAARWRGERRRTWLEAVTEWAEHESGQIAPSTAKRYAVSLSMVKPHLAAYAIEKVDGQAIATMISARRREGATPATVRRDLTAVSRVLDFAEAMGWREGNPTLSKRRLLKERRNPIVLPIARDIEVIIAAASTRFGALIRAARLTGCRQDELVQATWRGFNARGKTLEVIGKGNKRRTISLSETAAAHVSAQPVTLGCDLIFCREGGEAFSQAASDFTHVRRAVIAKAKKEKREFQRFRFHDLRHLFAVEALRGGMSIYSLSKHLGHTSVKTTEIYLEFLTPEEVARAKEGSAQMPAQPRRSA